MEIFLGVPPSRLLYYRPLSPPVSRCCEKRGLEAFLWQKGIAKKKKVFIFVLEKQHRRKYSKCILENRREGTQYANTAAQVLFQMFPIISAQLCRWKKNKENPKVEPVNSRRRSVTASKDSLLKRDEMLFVLVVCFAVGDICNVHHCSDTENISEAADCSHR